MEFNVGERTINKILLNLVSMFPDANRAYLTKEIHQTIERGDVATDDNDFVDFITNSVCNRMLELEQYPKEDARKTLISLLDDDVEIVGESKHSKEKEKVISAILETFPDASKAYVINEVDKLWQQSIHHDQVVMQLTNKMVDHSYPKKSTTAVKRTNTNVDFYNLNSSVTEEYKTQWYFYDFATHLNAFASLVKLSNDFPKLVMKEIQKAYNECKGHYAPAFKMLSELEASVGNNKRKSGIHLKGVRPPKTLPDVLEQRLADEILFVSTEKTRALEDRDRVLAHELQAEEYKESGGDLIECGCCYAEYIIDDLIQCEDCHLFCRNCVQKYAEETVFGQGKLKLHCLDAGGCKAVFPYGQLQKALSARVFEKYQQRIQEEEIKLAGLANLVECPFCEYRAEMPNKEDKVFKCLNPECMKESCRLCKEENHIPLKCSEVEKPKEKELRTTVEEKMSEALIRMCSKCKSKFFKEEGCNKMTCSSCGTASCYICRATIPASIGYKHFCACSQSRTPHKTKFCTKCKKCVLFLADTVAVNNEDVLAAGKQIEEELKAKDPQLQDTSLTITQEVQKNPKTKRPSPMMQVNILLPGVNPKKRRKMYSDDLIHFELTGGLRVYRCSMDHRRSA